MLVWNLTLQNFNLITYYISVSPNLFKNIYIILQIMSDKADMKFTWQQKYM